MWGLKLADTQALKRKRKYTVIIFKEKLTLAELTPELRTYKKLGLCIQFDENIDRMAAKIRYISAFFQCDFSTIVGYIWPIQMKTPDSKKMRNFQCKVN